MSRTLISSSLTLALCAALAACGPAPVTQRDVRVAVPAADGLHVDFVTAETVVPAGGEKLFCTEFAFDGDDTAFNEVISLQGKFGHHVVVLSTANPRGAGSSYDCTEMTDFLPFAILGDGWPTGFGSQLKKGTPLVVQSHYVNSGSTDILTRDVVRLTKLAPASVTTWVAPFSLYHPNFSVPPHGTASVNFDCTFPQDVGLMLLGGHMHEWGSAFKVETGLSTTALTTAYEVTAWKAEYRDTPPVNLNLTTQVPVKAGTIMRTTCSWSNDTDKALTHPHEMCVTFGLMTGTKDAYLCKEQP